MRKIIQPGVPEQSERLCDVNGKPAYARLVMVFEYGSRLDNDGLDVDLSEEVAEDVLILLRSKYPQFTPHPHEAVPFYCPWCRRGP